MTQTLTFGTKAETLELLRRSITAARVLPSTIFSVREWRNGRDSVVGRIRDEYAGRKVIVRSSVLTEDSASASMAGKFESVADVDPSSDGLIAAVDFVVSSFGDANADDQIFVQRQLSSVRCGGVVFTRDVDTRAPYYVVNYDSESGSTSSVTSGNGSRLRTYLRHRDSPLEVKDFRLARIIAACREVEELFGNDALDIEFAVTEDEELYILQVRPLAGTVERKRSDPALARSLLRVYQKIQKLNLVNHPNLLGSKSIYSVMSDWNPAEIIGLRPRPLALSLYKELVTDSVWAYQRNNYGYRNLRSFPLLFSFLGVPYIDVRSSFNSFVPASLDPGLSEKLVNYYLDMLRGSPADHDKIEFKIVYSCYYLNLSTKLKRLLNFGFTELELDRIKFALLTLTNGIIGQENGHYKNDLRRVEELKLRFDRICGSELSLTDKIYWLIEDCKRYGTLPFAGLARAGFMAVQFVRSMIDCGIITASESERYMNSLNTVTRRLSEDHRKVRDGAMSKEDFLFEYGHLRPGTYDINSKRYDEAFEYFFAEGNAGHPNEEYEPFVFTQKQREQIAKELLQNGVSVSVDSLLTFMKEAIEGREYSKFIFTRSLSKVLRLVESLGSVFDLGRDDMSFVEISTIMRLYSVVGEYDLGQLLRESIAQNREHFEVTELVRLPEVITAAEEVFDFHVNEAQPNYVTLGKVTAQVLLEEDFPQADLSGKIVFIRSADPGYDWLFSRGIGGLITMFGGANSHMAIRCSELQIPAAIGCGQQNFVAWSRSNVLELDCENKKVTALQ